MAGVNWLHLSDWHQRGPDFDRKVLRDKLIEDIKNREKIDPSLAQLDFVVFSGDISFSGQGLEFQTAKTEFFERILAATSLKPELLFMVPGNHDLDRGVIKEMVPPELQEPLRTTDRVNHWLTDDRRRARALEPFEAYVHFVTDFTGQKQPAYASFKTLHIDGPPALSVGLLGLNSAWMCARVRDQRGEFKDEASLVIGEPQIHDALEQLARHDLRIVVMHHPFEWLAEFDRARVMERLQGAAHFILRGHEHLPNVQVASTLAGVWIGIPAGASYDRRQPEDQQYVNSYNFCSVLPEGGVGTVFLRRWSERRKAWVEDNDAYPVGKFEFKLPAELIKPPVISTSNPSSAKVVPQVTAEDSEAATISRREAAAKRYRDLILESCDIVDLANLPERDRHLAARQLELRRLYVPLRARSEVVQFGMRSALRRYLYHHAAGIQSIRLPGIRAHFAPDFDFVEAAGSIWEKPDAIRYNPEMVRYIVGSQSPDVTPQLLTTGDRVSIGERLAQAKRVVVLGEPGAGKTTLTRWIATAYLLKLRADPDWKDLPDVQTLPDVDWLPIIVRCRDLDGGRSAESLDNMLRHTLERTELSTDEIARVREYLLQEIEAERALFILDGLDEITEPLNRARFCERIEAIAVAHPNLPIIATSRIVGYREMGRRLGRGFEHLTLTELTREEKNEFARRWSALTEIPVRREAAAEELIADIHSTDRIERLTGNPMLLTTMALVKRRVGKLPQRRADLYWEAVQVLLNWRREVDAPIDQREAIPQLEYLAYAMCDQGVQRLRNDEVVALLRRMRAEYPNVHTVQNRDVEEFLRVLEARTGMLVEAGYERFQGRPVPVYEFRHLTFQEYLAALALVDGRFPGRKTGLNLAQIVAPLAGRTTRRSGISHYISYEEPAVVESWRETLRLCVSVCNDDDVDAVLKGILEPLKGEPKATRSARLLQAAACLADEPNASIGTVAEIAKTLAAECEEQESARPSGFSRAALELSNTRWVPTFTRALTEGFLSCAPARREMVGLVLGALSWGPSRSAAARDEWYDARLEEIRRGDERVATIAISGLIWGVTTDALTLKRGVTGALINRLDNAAPVAHAAAWALALLGGSAQIPLIKRRWMPTAAQRRALMERLPPIRENGYALCWLSMLLGNAAANETAGLLKDLLQVRDGQLALRGVEALGRMGSKIATNALLNVLAADKRPALRAAAARSLGSFGGEEVVRTLTEKLHSEINVTVQNAIFSSIVPYLPKIDRRLVSRDLDGEPPFINFQDAIEPSRIEEAAKEIRRSVEETKSRFEALSRKLGLRVNWPTSDVAVSVSAQQSRTIHTEP